MGLSIEKRGRFLSEQQLLAIGDRNIPAWEDSESFSIRTGILQCGMWDSLQPIRRSVLSRSTSPETGTRAMKQSPGPSIILIDRRDGRWNQLGS